MRWRLAVLAGFGLAAMVPAIAGCSPLVALNDWLVPAQGHVRHADIAYGAGPRQALDVYRPWPLAPEAEPAPVVVFFYGGSWKGGERAYYRFVGEALTSRGIVAVIPDYRVYPDARFPAFIDDGAAAVRWVEDNIGRYGGDARAIVLMGHSAGAHIAAMLIADDRYLDRAGARASAIRGFVGLAGPYAFDPLAYGSIRPIFEDADDPTMPIGLIDGGEPPMLLLHGAGDRTVKPENSRALAERSRLAGGAAEIVEYDDLGHIGILLALAHPFRGEAGMLDRIAAFVERRVHGGDPLACRRNDAALTSC
jgi:acetyl esterase/lipase